MRQQRDPDAQFLDLWCAFVNAASNAEPVQVERQRKSANTPTDNCDVAFDAHACKPKKRANRTARSSSASSPPAQPMNESPTGEPATIPTGNVTCGRPLWPDMQVSRMARRRNISYSSGAAS